MSLLYPTAVRQGGELEGVECLGLFCLRYLIVATMHEDFWCPVVSSSYGGVEALTVCSPSAQPEVSDGDVASLVKENVVHFEVPMDDPHLSRQKQVI